MPEPLMERVGSRSRASPAGLGLPDAALVDPQPPACPLLGDVSHVDPPFEERVLLQRPPPLGEPRLLYVFDQEDAVWVPDISAPSGPLSLQQRQLPS